MVMVEGAACLSFLGTYSLKQLNETFSGGGGRRPLFRMPGPLPSVKHSPNMQLCKRPGSQSSEQPAARGVGIPWGRGEGGTAPQPLRQALGLWDARKARPLVTSLGEESGQQLGCDKSLKLASLSLSKSPPSFKFSPIKRLLLKEQPWYFGARLCQCFQRWTERASSVEILRQQV